MRLFRLGTADVGRKTMSLRSLGRRWCQFQHETSGAVAILFALSLIPVVLVAGSALDYVQANDVKGKLQAALDSAALAAATSGNLTDDERLALAKKAFEENFTASKTRGIRATPEFTIANDS